MSSLHGADNFVASEEEYTRRGHCAKDIKRKELTADIKDAIPTLPSFFPPNRFKSCKKHSLKKKKNYYCSGSINGHIKEERSVTCTSSSFTRRYNRCSLCPLLVCQVDSQIHSSSPSEVAYESSVTCALLPRGKGANRDPSLCQPQSWSGRRKRMGEALLGGRKGWRRQPRYGGLRLGTDGGEGD